MNFSYHSGIYTLTESQGLPIGINEAWDFFSDPDNLKVITPGHMAFDITSGTDRIYPGQIISYRVSIFPGIRINWVTEITHVEDQRYFVDEQRFGPYAMWHHEHHFREKGDGITMMDKISFKIPLGIVGRVAFHLFIKRQLKAIFAFRSGKLGELFPANT